MLAVRGKNDPADLITKAVNGKLWDTFLKALGFVHAIPLKTNSNDFGGFWNELAESNSNFVVAENFF